MNNPLGLAQLCLFGLVGFLLVGGWYCALAFLSRSGAAGLMFGGRTAMAKTPEAATSRVRGAKKFGLTTSNVAGCAPASAVDGPRVGEGMAIRRMASP